MKSIYKRKDKLFIGENQGTQITNIQNNKAYPMRECKPVVEQDVVLFDDKEILPFKGREKVQKVIDGGTIVYIGSRSQAQKIKKRLCT